MVWLDFRRRWRRVDRRQGGDPLLSGLLDAFTWNWPFQSLALNLWINVGQGVATGFAGASYARGGNGTTRRSGAFGDHQIARTPSIAVEIASQSTAGNPYAPCFAAHVRATARSASLRVTPGS